MDPPLRVREDWWVFERPFFKGKEGRVGFRRFLKVQGRTGRFSKDPSLMGRTGVFSKTS